MMALTRNRVEKRFLGGRVITGGGKIWWYRES